MHTSDLSSARVRTSRSAGVLAALAIALVLGGCSALPDKPQRAVLYDFGPAPAASTAAAAPDAPRLATLTLAEVEANTRLDGTQLLYRLGYADANELRPYGQSRWSQAPAQLLRQRLRDNLSQRRMVLEPEESATIARAEVKPRTLRIALEEFTHYFEAPSRSVGLVRVRATLTQATVGGDHVLGQRVFTARQPAPSADAAGGVKALAASSDSVVAEIAAWVDQIR
ncbi:MAG: hypothetical protein EOO24_06705 [Comamonadaceae bacterium]|nr:MAG: hypothetical protein EOO24_06705 [Comamonadaceae bacterium]